MKFISLFLALALIFCVAFAGAESAAPAAQPIPVEIRSLSVGDQASVTFANTGDQDCMLVTFRFRGWDAEGNLVNIYKAVASGSVPGESQTIMLQDYTCIPFLSPGGVETEDLSLGYEARHAARLEAAVQQYTLLDGTSHRIPESQLVWFSSDTGYPEGVANAFDYEYPDASVFKKSYTFSLGVSVTRIYPEYEEYFGLSHAGYRIAEVRHGLFSNAGIRQDDLLWAMNGIALTDDPFALEKAKAAIVDGQPMVLSVLRNGEEITITLPPEVMLTPP